MFQETVDKSEVDDGEAQLRDGEDHERYGSNLIDDGNLTVGFTDIFGREG